MKKSSRQNLSCRLDVRVQSKTRRQLERLARKARVGLSAYIRRLLEQATDS